MKILVQHRGTIFDLATLPLRSSFDNPIAKAA